MIIRKYKKKKGGIDKKEKEKKVVCFKFYEIILILKTKKHLKFNDFLILHSLS